MKYTNKLVRLFLAISLLTACSNSTLEESNNNNQDNTEEIEKPYQYSGATHIQINDRSFTLEDIPEIYPEELVVNNYYYDIAGEYDKLGDLYGENEALKISADNEKKNFDEGIYVKEYIIHDVAPIAEDELDEMLAKQIASDIEKYTLSDSLIIKADIDLVWAETAEAPQIGNGRYPRIFLCGRQSVEDDWKIYECYWGEMYGY